MCKDFSRNVHQVDRNVTQNLSSVFISPSSDMLSWGRKEREEKSWSQHHTSARAGLQIQTFSTASKVICGYGTPPPRTFFLWGGLFRLPPLPPWWHCINFYAPQTEFAQESITEFCSIKKKKKKVPFPRHGQSLSHSLL